MPAPSHGTVVLDDSADGGIGKIGCSFGAVFRCRFGPRWLSRADEKALFAGWDETYRAIRQKRIDMGISILAPADSTELHRSNVIAKLAHEHQGTRISRATE